MSHFTCYLYRHSASLHQSFHTIHRCCCCPVCGRQGPPASQMTPASEASWRICWWTSRWNQAPLIDSGWGRGASDASRGRRFGLLRFGGAPSWRCRGRSQGRWVREDCLNVTVLALRWYFWPFLSTKRQANSAWSRQRQAGKSVRWSELRLCLKRVSKAHRPSPNPTEGHSCRASDRGRRNSADWTGPGWGSWPRFAPLSSPWTTCSPSTSSQTVTCCRGEADNSAFLGPIGVGDQWVRAKPGSMGPSY